MNENRFRTLIAEIFGDAIVLKGLRALENLPDTFTYHTLQHTRDVLHEAVRFAVVDNLDDEQIRLLAIAAAFHDSGFLVRRENNEPEGAALAAAAMASDSRFTPEHISCVRQMILDTQLQSTNQGVKQIATIPLSAYLLDADMSNLGREDFLTKWDLLRAENGGDRRQFLRQTQELLRAHRWHTPAARMLRERRKEENLRLVERLLAEECHG